MPEAAPDPLREALDRHWRRNLRLVAALLAVWAFAGLGCGVLLAEPLNRFALGGFPLGFWFAQQGAILVFVLLILVYALAMRRLDRRHHAELEAIRAGDPAPR
jgi:putative solute:sodium symporter small subunit